MTLLDMQRTRTLFSAWRTAEGDAVSTTTTREDEARGKELEEQYLCTAALDGHVKVWEASGKQLYDHVVTDKGGNPSPVTALVQVTENTPAGESSVIVTACDDKALKLWTLPTFDRRGILTQSQG